MSLFDNLLKQLDNGLKAVESGELEKRLNQFADVMEANTKQAGNTLDAVAKRPGEVLKAAEAKKATVEHKAQMLGEHAKKAMEEISAKRTSAEYGGMAQ